VFGLRVSELNSWFVWFDSVACFFESKRSKNKERKSTNGRENEQTKSIPWLRFFLIFLLITHLKKSQSNAHAWSVLGCVGFPIPVSG
jgi:hypothetical protein